MKKILFTGVLCLVASISFGQKKAVSAAKNEIKGNTPNFAEARSLIKGALENPETANDAETWYVAGQIEDKQFDLQRTNEILGKKPDEPIMYGALEKILPYFIKAAEFDQRPDEKGKVKPKFLKDIKAKVRTNLPFYINAGIYYYENQNYKKAFENFKTYGDIPSLEMFKGDVWEKVQGDSTEVQIRYYAGLAATMIPDHQAAIDIFTELKDSGYNENELYQRLCLEYTQIGDSVSYAKIIKEGFTKFPSENYFILNLINLSINSGSTDEAVTYLESAIKLDPQNPQLYDVLGMVYETAKDFDKAILYMKKSLELDSENVETLLHIGRVYFNLGVETRTAADNISDANQSKAESKKALDYFKDSMPFFEKVFEADPKNMDAIYALRSIYYNLGMEQYEKMDALYNAQQ
jgi:tetratricopeptide (TPR) repeat protein